MTKPGMIITGATGFLGKQLVERLRHKYEIFGIGRRSAQEAGLPFGPDLHWFQADVGHFESLREVFYQIRQTAKIELLLRLAAFYDFTGDDVPEYTRTNVAGTRNVLELSLPLNLERFIFTSSVAACPFPQAGEAVTEDTPPTAPVPYARSKRQGEEMMHEFRDRIPSTIVRLAAIVSDWCEYEPLANFILTWCSGHWNARILGGRGQSAIPYLHVRDLIAFYLRVIEKHRELEPVEVLQASPNGSTTHLELYREVTRSLYGTPRPAIFMPKPLAGVGIAMRERLGRLTANMPYERSWMADYIDLKLNVDASRTHHRLDWTPSPDLEILKTIPFMVHNMKEDFYAWQERSYLSSTQSQAVFKTYWAT